LSFFIEKILLHTLKIKNWKKKNLIYKVIIIIIYISLIFLPGKDGHSDKHHKIPDKYSL